MTLLQIIVFGLATWRVSSLLVNEDGPWFIFLRIREWSGIELHPVNPNYYHAASTEWIPWVPQRLIPQILSCVWCTSIYVGLVWSVFFLLSPAIAFYIALSFALSTCAIVLSLVVEKLKN